MKTKTEVTRRKTEVSYFRWRHTFSPIFFQLFNLFRRSSREWSLEGEDGTATCWREDITSHHPASRRSVLLVRVSVLTLGDGSRVCIMLTHFGIDCLFQGSAASSGVLSESPDATSCVEVRTWDRHQAEDRMRRLHTGPFKPRICERKPGALTRFCNGF